MMGDYDLTGFAIGYYLVVFAITLVITFVAARWRSGQSRLAAGALAFLLALASPVLLAFALGAIYNVMELVE